jgi:hypothetical protein
LVLREEGIERERNGLDVAAVLDAKVNGGAAEMLNQTGRGRGGEQASSGS